MDNYYKQRAELEVAQERLNSKLEEKEQIYKKYFGRRIKDTSKDVNASIKGTSVNQDKMTAYLIELEDKGLFKEIENLQNEVRIKKYHLKNMERILSNLKGVEYDFLKLRYFEEKEYTLEEIALELDYSISKIEKLSSNIEKKIKSNLCK